MDEKGKNNGRLDKALDKLIARLSSETPKNFLRPSDECIRAYLLGLATEEQKSETWSALDTSPAFRQEILEIANELETFASEVTAREAAKLKVENVPKAISRLIEPRPKPSILEIFKKYFTFPRAIPAIASAALVLFVSLYTVQYFWPGSTDRLDTNSVQQPPDTAELPADNADDATNVVEPVEPPALSKWALVSEEVDPGLLISMLPRDASTQASTKTYTAPDSAALAEFRFLLSFEDGEFKLQPEPKRPVFEQVSRTVQLTILDQNERMIRKITAEIPVSDTAITTIEAWLLSLPSRTLYKVDMTKDSMTVKIDNKEIPKGGITFTFGSGNWFKSTLGFVFKSAMAE